MLLSTIKIYFNSKDKEAGLHIVSNETLHFFLKKFFSLFSII